MARPLRIGAQAIAVAAVLGLLALLVWRVAQGNDGGAAAALDRGRLIYAPNFTLPRLDGRGDLRLSSLRGKVVVVNFWASWCEPCKAEAPHFQAVAKEYARRGVVVVGVDVQDFRGDAKRFARRHGLTYPLVHDATGKTLEPYGVELLPETFVVGRNGKLVGDRVQGQVTRAELERSVRRALQA